MKTIKNYLKNAFRKYCEMNYEAYKPMWDNGICWM
jgi:hypothetical protein